MGQINIVYLSFLLIYFQQTTASNKSQVGVIHNDNVMHGNNSLRPTRRVFRSQENSLNSISRVRSHHYDDQNNFETMYQGVHMGPQMRHLEYNFESTNASETTNVMVQIQLIDYIDQGFQLPNGQTCICPSEFSCSYLGTSIPRCYMSFTVILLSPDESVKYFSTEFMPLAPSGNIDIDSMSLQQKKAWQQFHIFHLTSKPSAIDIFVHHMGSVINAHTGELTQIQTVVHVDTFILPLNSVIPSIENGHLSMQSRNLNGVVLQTQLTVAYSVQCKGALIGLNCDLICNEAVANRAVAVCQSNITNFFYTCTYMKNGQVQNCLPCPWGITQASYCQNSKGDILALSAAGMVPSSFKVATITLGILASILLIFLIVMIIYLTLIGKRVRENAPFYNTISEQNYRSTLRSEGGTNRPLLQSINNVSHNQFKRVSTAVLHSTPQLDVLPAKSSLRKTIPLLQAHLCGVSSLNDTLNSTLSSVPLQPS
ncbi:Sodium/hydrogen exchanger [Dirofilaria immitis]